ncbi:MAG: hypothetical protein WCK98_03315 [bacterium]
MESITQAKNEIQKAPEQKKTPGYLQNIVQNLPKMSMKAIRMVLPALLAGGVVTQVSPDYQYTTPSKENTTQHNPLNKDSIQTASNINGRANVNVIVMPDGKCYVTNDHVTVDKVGLSEFRTMQKRYDIKVFEQSDGIKKISCKEQLLGLVKYQTNDQLNKHLEQNPQLELHTLHSSQKPNNSDYSKLGRVPFSDSINEKEQVIKGKFLYGTSSDFLYAIQSSENTQTAPGTSAGGIYNKNGEFIGMHSASFPTFNLKLLNDALNPELLNLDDLLKIAKLPHHGEVSWDEKDYAQKKQQNDDKDREITNLEKSFKQKLIASKRLNKDELLGYNYELIKHLVRIMSKEIKQTESSKTYKILASRNIKAIVNNSIDTEIDEYLKKTINNTNTAEASIYQEKATLMRANRANLAESILRGDQIVQGVHFTKQTIEPLQLKPVI